MQFQRIESAIISATVGSQRQLPVNLDLIIKQIGAAIRYTYCRDAFTHFQATGPVIYLSTAAPKTRHRFMVAHEIAHVLLRTRPAIEVIEKHGQTSLLDNEEDLANRIAGALLVPDNWIDGMKETRLTTARLWEVANRAGIPISMLITRVERAGIDVALLHWRRGRRSWHVIDRPGTPVFLHGRVELSELGRRALDHLGGEESEILLDCRISGMRVTIKGRGCRRGNGGEHAFHFLAPHRDVSFVAADRRVTAVPGRRAPG